MAPRPPRKVPEFTEVDYKTKAGVAWSHNYLNQKPWHPMSYPNQRRKWIAEQEHAVRETQKGVAAKEFAEEQEFFKEAALLSESERKRIELAQAVSFMYQRPPGYNPDIDIKRQEKPEEKAEEAKKPRAKDVFGRSIATGEEFEALKDAPKLETGIVGKAKPFGIEIRNVKCARCGAFGHQSGERDCPLRDVQMPGEVERQKREDPLQAILASVPQEAPKWTLKDGGRSPPRGGFHATAENQQILPPDEMELQMAAEADAAANEMQPVDEAVLAQLSKSERKALLRAYNGNGIRSEEGRKERKKRKKHRRKKRESSESSEESSDTAEDRKKRRKRRQRKREPESSESESGSELEHKERQRGHSKKESGVDVDERVEAGREVKRSTGKEREENGRKAVDHKDESTDVYREPSRDGGLEKEVIEGRKELDDPDSRGRSEADGKRGRKERHEEYEDLKRERNERAEVDVGEDRGRKDRARDDHSREREGREEQRREGKRVREEAEGDYRARARERDVRGSREDDGQMSELERREKRARERGAERDTDHYGQTKERKKDRNRYDRERDGRRDRGDDKHTR